MRVLVDTNVLLSAALRDGLPERVVRHIALEDSFHWIVTQAILEEYKGVISRPKFALHAGILAEWTALLELRTILVSDPPSAVDFPRDPKDAIFLAAAIAAGADLLITGDADLLQARIETRIITPAMFAHDFLK